MGTFLDPDLKAVLANVTRQCPLPSPINALLGALGGQDARAHVLGFAVRLAYLLPQPTLEKLRSTLGDMTGIVARAHARHSSQHQHQHQQQQQQHQAALIAHHGKLPPFPAGKRPAGIMRGGRWALLTLRASTLSQPVGHLLDDPFVFLAARGLLTPAVLDVAAGLLAAPHACRLVGSSQGKGSMSSEGYLSLSSALCPAESSSGGTACHDILVPAPPPLQVAAAEEGAVSSAEEEPFQQHRPLVAPSPAFLFPVRQQQQQKGAVAAASPPKSLLTPAQVSRTVVVWGLPLVGCQQKKSGSGGAPQVGLSSRALMTPEHLLKLTSHLGPVESVRLFTHRAQAYASGYWGNDLERYQSWWLQGQREAAAAGTHVGEDDSPSGGGAGAAAATPAPAEQQPTLVRLAPVPLAASPAFFSAQRQRSFSTLAASAAAGSSAASGAPDKAAAAPAPSGLSKAPPSLKPYPPPSSLAKELQQQQQRASRKASAAASAPSPSSPAPKVRAASGKRPKDAAASAAEDGDSKGNPHSRKKHPPKQQQQQQQARKPPSGPVTEVSSAGQIIYSDLPPALDFSAYADSDEEDSLRGGEEGEEGGGGDPFAAPPRPLPPPHAPRCRHAHQTSPPCWTCAWGPAMGSARKRTSRSGSSTSTASCMRA